VICGVITGGLQRKRWKFFVSAFRLLQTNHVGLRVFQPSEKAILAFAQ
jgi:hypothetical protein